MMMIEEDRQSDDEVLFGLNAIRPALCSLRGTHDSEFCHEKQQPYLDHVKPTKASKMDCPLSEYIRDSETCGCRQAN